jgi:hypothetical protein
MEYKYSVTHSSTPRLWSQSRSRGVGVVESESWSRSRSRGVGVVESESESEGILGGVGVTKNVPTPTPTSI